MKKMNYSARGVKKDKRVGGRGEMWLQKAGDYKRKQRTKVMNEMNDDRRR